MTIQEINISYYRVIGSLDNKELKNAFTFLYGMVAGIQAYQYQEKLDNLQDTYTYMLRYRLDGVKDPMEDQIYHSLMISAYEMADQVRDRALVEISPLLYYSKRRSSKVVPVPSYGDLQIQLAHRGESPEENKMFEMALATLFQRIWISAPLTTDDVLAIKEILFDESVHPMASCQIVSALWMALQTSFDKEKLFLLFDALYHTDEEIRTRALICIMLTLFVYNKRTYLYPQITERLAAYSEANPAFTKELRTIILRFILSRETEKITRKLQEEIIPEMMKLGPKINKKINLRDLTADQIGDEMNPEWQDMIGDSHLGKMMEEFSELQQEGADVMHSTFVHLKSFPFFRELSNWFLPFTPLHSGFNNKYTESDQEHQVLDALTNASFMCNSDKYSLYFSMLQLPEQHRNMMLNQFTGQASEMIEQNKEELISQRGKFEIITGQYIQDLYRFYKLFPARIDFTDIFSLSLDFHNLPILKPYITDAESLTIIAEYYLRKHYFADALVLFEELVEKNPDSDILFQKIGYCKQMTDDLEGALEAYMRADLLNTESKWLIKHIAGCYRTLKQPEEALTYYKRIEALDPDDLTTQLNIGHCLLELKDYSEALRYFFKVDYLDTKRNRAWRPIAWISFTTGKYDQARKYYRKILDKNPNMQDYLNAGHVEWALQNVKGAIAYYKKSVEAESGDIHKFLEQFNQDTNELLAAGIEENEIPFMLDELRYSLDNTF